MYHRKYKNFIPDKVIEEENKRVISALKKALLYLTILNLILIPFSYSKYNNIRKMSRIEREKENVVIPMIKKTNNTSIDKTPIEKIIKLKDKICIEDFQYKDNVLTFKGNYQSMDNYLMYFEENKIDLITFEKQGDKDVRIAVRIK